MLGLKASSQAGAMLSRGGRAKPANVSGPSPAHGRRQAIVCASQQRPRTISSRTAVVQPEQRQQLELPPTQDTSIVSAGPAQGLPLLGPLQDAWDAVDVKQKLCLASMFGFCLSNMDKTNFTVAIIPMAVTYGWTPTVAGLVQSAFFYGFLLMQLPGGFLSTKLGGSYVLPRGLALWSGATAAIPIMAGSMPALCATRAIMGAGEAVAPSSIIDMITRTVPASERAGAVSFAFSGLHLGSIIGLLVSPLIIQAFDWPALFLLFGGVGGLWLVWFQGLLDEVARKDPELSLRLFPDYSRAGRLFAAPKELVDRATEGVGAAAQTPMQMPPYRAFLRNRSVRVLMFTHFCHNWFSYTMLSWLPTFFTSTLSIDLMHAAQTALLPPMAGIVTSAVAGTMGNKLIAAGVPLPRVRKLAQSMGFLLPTACLALASQVPCTPEDSATAVACITAALGLSSFSLAGLYCSHGDLSTKYSAALLGMTNVAGSLPGIIGVATVGALLDQTNSWSLALFVPSGVLMLAGTAVYVGFGSHAPVDFDSEDNSEFAWEKTVKQWWAKSPAAGAARQVAGAAKQVAGAVSAVTALVTKQQQQRENGDRQ